MTSLEDATVFRLIDSYARNQHQCFVAEFDFDKTENNYRVCFRPARGTKDSPNRYACRYLHFGIRDITETAKNQELPASVIEKLDKELPSLGRLV